MAERVRRTLHRIGPARVPRSRDRIDGGRLAARAERVRCVRLTNTHAPRPEQGCTRSPSGRAANGWPRDRDSAGWRVAPPLRAPRCVASSRSCRSSRWAARPTRVYAASLQEASGDAVHLRDSGEAMRKHRLTASQAALSNPDRLNGRDSVILGSWIQPGIHRQAAESTGAFVSFAEAIDGTSPMAGSSGLTVRAAIFTRKMSKYSARARRGNIPGVAFKLDLVPAVTDQELIGFKIEQSRNALVVQSGHHQPGRNRAS